MQPSNLELFLRKVVKSVSGLLLANKYSVILIALLSLAIIVYSFARETDLSVYPFIAQVWGDASNWVSLSISFVAMVFLYSTLQSQVESQKYQQAQTAVILDEYIPKIMPNLIDNHFDVGPLSSFSIEDKKLSAEMAGTIENIGADALDVTYESKDIVYGFHNGIQIFKKHNRVHFKIMAHSLRLEHNGSVVTHKVTFRYRDRLKNEYNQEMTLSFRFTCKDYPRPDSFSEKEISFSDPILVKYYLPI